MGIKKYFSEIMKKVEYINKNIENPFTSKKYQQKINPFETEGIANTYVWLEKDNK